MATIKYDTVTIQGANGVTIVGQGSVFHMSKDGVEWSSLGATLLIKNGKIRIRKA